MTTLQKAIKYLAIALAVALIAAICTGVFRIAGVLGGFGESAVGPETKTYAVTGNVQDLQIAVGAADMTICSGDQLQVQSNLLNLKVEQKDGCLHIVENVKAGLYYDGAVLRLTVPEGMVFENLQVETGAGILTAHCLTGGEVRLELGAGKAVIERLEARESATIEGGAGKIEVHDGTIRNLKLEMGVGDVQMTAALQGSSTLDYGVGKASLTLLGTPDAYAVTFHKGLGNMLLDGKPVEDGVTVGSGDSQITVNGGIGNADIRFGTK